MGNPARTHTERKATLVDMSTRPFLQYSLRRVWRSPMYKPVDIQTVANSISDQKSNPCITPSRDVF
jgi:hypothetical protein